jgi:hypothetical protein
MADTRLPVFLLDYFPNMTTITPRVVKTKINTCRIESVSFKNITASIEQQSGERLLTTPIKARGIYFVHKKFIIDPTEPYTDLKISGLMF